MPINPVTPDRFLWTYKWSALCIFEECADVKDINSVFILVSLVTGLGALWCGLWLKKPLSSVLTFVSNISHSVGIWYYFCYTWKKKFKRALWHRYGTELITGKSGKRKNYINTYFKFEQIFVECRIQWGMILQTINIWKTSCYVAQWWTQKV